MTTPITERANQLDVADPLRSWRDQFFIPDPDIAYLDGNSLGMPPRRTLERIETMMRTEWADDLIASWDHWVDLPRRVGDKLAPVIGAQPGEVIVHDSTTINLYQLVRSALRLRPGRSTIAIDAGDFPTDRYVVEAIASQDGLTVVPTVDLDAMGSSTVDDLAVVVRSMIDYRTAELVDITAETRRVSDVGALVVWDLSHSAGLHPVGLNAADAELAVGCTYKFLNGGPGAPAFTYVSNQLIEHIDEPFHGWFANSNQFAMGPEFVPRNDIGRMLVGTPGILGLIAAEIGIETTAAAGIEQVRAKSVDLGRFALECCDALGLTSATPRDDDRRGGHVCVNHPDAKLITVALARGHRVVGDFREPDVIRLGLSPLTTRFADIARATTAIADMS